MPATRGAKRARPKIENYDPGLNPTSAEGKIHNAKAANSPPRVANPSLKVDIPLFVFTYISPLAATPANCNDPV